MRRILSGLSTLLLCVSFAANLHAQGNFRNTKKNLRSPKTVLASQVGMSSAYFFSGGSNQPGALPFDPLAGELSGVPGSPFMTGPQLVSILVFHPPAAPQLATGTMSGSASRLAQSGFQPIAGAQIRLLQDGTPVSQTTTDDLGQYAFLDVATGIYQLQMTSPEGLTAQIEAHVADGVETRVNFFHDTRSNQLFAFKPAVAVSSADPQIDVNGDGVVNLLDLNFVQQCQGGDPLDPNCALGDVNGDGVIDTLDLDLIRASFEQNVLSVPRLYGAPVSLGGSIALIGDDFPVVSNAGGLTEVMLQPDPTNPRQVILQAVSDRGTALSPPPVGSIRFTEDLADPTTAAIDLDTGRFVAGGRLTLLVSGSGFDNVGVNGDILFGQIVFRPGGFGLYQAIVAGTLPPEFPLLGGLAFAMVKCEESKPNVNCSTVQAEVGDPICGKGGFKCVTPGAACAFNGKQGVCTTIVVPGVGPPANKQCIRCACF